MKKKALLCAAEENNKAIEKNGGAFVQCLNRGKSGFLSLCLIQLRGLLQSQLVHAVLLQCKAVLL